ncbi:hypothetical protein ACTJKC_09530 [Pedobacter sp. 22226]|uniref:hypothetical protein n=1 Tax=Pedobacter sp. 22226 TaxID=3453894 RepID=UPI003F836661
MFEDYKKAILDFYRIKKENHLLTENLEFLGREKLKKECIKVFKLKNTQKDKDFIQSVFDPEKEYEDQIRSIEKFDLDKFRPLISFLTIEGRNIRDEKLVKLFAWLLDFPPFSEWRELSEEEQKLILLEANKVPAPTPHKPKPIPPRPDVPEELIQLPRFSTRYIIATCILLLFIGTTSFVAWENSATVIRNPTTDEKCMYWDDDHYEPVNCNAQINGVTIIPLDLKKLQHQRKINLPDTLTTYSLGKVWYKGFVKDHEFFTDSGAYPQDIQRVLKPLTNTILTKYTSNYRYMLTRLVWFLCAALFVSLCGIGASKTKKKIKISNQNETSNSRIEDFSKTNSPIIT